MSFIHRKKKGPIFFVIHGLPMGGAEMFLISLINHIEQKMGNAVLILLGGECTLIDRVHKNVEIIILRKRHRLDIGMIISLALLYRKMKPSKVFCINAYSFFISKLASVGKKGISFYLSPHTTAAFSWKYELLSKIFLSSFSNNDTVIFLCHYQEKYMRYRYLSGRGKSLVIYNGIDLAYNNPRSVSNQTVKGIREYFHIQENEFVILNVARISREKGHQHAIDALKMLHEIYDIKAHLLLVGNGEMGMMNELKEYVRKNELDHYVHFAGVQQDVRPYYATCNVFTLASISETFSLSALEAMAFGKPCVLTEVGGAREMIQSHMNGLLARVEDAGSIARAWNHLLGRPALNHHIIRAEIKKRFDINRMLHGYVHILQEK